MSELRIVVADDHVGLRHGIAMFFNTQPDMVTVGEASTGLETIELVCELKPDILVVDNLMAGCSGLEAIQRIRKEWSELKALVYSMQTGQKCVIEAVKAGAVGYLCKDASCDQLIAAIREIAQGRSIFSTAIKHAPLHETAKGTVYSQGLKEAPNEPQATTYAPLSKREEQVLVLVAKGHTSKEIAVVLAISAGSVDTYRARLLKKLSLTSRAALVHYAIKVGLV